jgi:hypothetical protein
VRPDLQQLTPEALAALANWGLVKRAQKEIEAGLGPTLTDSEDELVATFADGVTCRLPAGRPWTQAQCSCPASMCRHRIALVLALPQTKEQEPQLLHLDLKQLKTCLGSRLMERARRLRDQGMQAQLSGPPWQVRLPTNTVRFLSGGDLHYARCDCEREWPCEHLALASWVVDGLKGVAGRVDWSGTRAEIQLDLHEVWQEGCLGQLPAAPAGCIWIQLLLEEMADLKLAYSQGAAHYDSRRWLFCALSLWSRCQASGADLSPEYRLGQGLPIEQELEQIRLISLGATRGPKGTHLFFADPAGVVLRLHLPSGKSPPGGLPMPDLAYGQLISNGVVRRANQCIRLRRQRQRHSLSPLGCAWKQLPPSLMWPGWEAWRQRQADQVSRLLRPPTVSEDFMVVEVTEIHSMVYLPGPQKLVIHVQDSSGGELWVERCHNAQAPAALDALVGQLPATRWLSGWVQSSSGRAVLNPVALWGPDGLSIPDLETTPHEWDLPWLVDEPDESPLHGLLREALGLCSETLHLGHSQLLPSFRERRQELAERLEEAGLLDLARRLRGPWTEETFWPCALRVSLGLESLALMSGP